jgi:hypothetical protein
MKCYFVLFFIYFSLKFSNESKLSLASKRKFKKKMKEIDNMYNLLDSQTLQDQQRNLPDFRLNTIDKSLEVIESHPRFEQSEDTKKNSVSNFNHVEKTSTLKTFGIDEPVTKIKEITYRKPIYVNEDYKSVSQNLQRKNEEKKNDEIESKFLQTSLTEDKKEIVFNSNQIDIEVGTPYRKAIVLGADKNFAEKNLKKETKKLIIIGRKEISNNENNLISQNLLQNNSKNYNNNNAINPKTEENSNKINEKVVEKGAYKGIEKGIQKGIDKGIDKGVEKGILNPIYNPIVNPIVNPTVNPIEKSIRKGVEKTSLESISEFGDKLSELIKNILFEVVRGSKQLPNYEKIIESHQPDIKNLVKNTLFEVYNNSSHNLEKKTNKIDQNITFIKSNFSILNKTHSSHDSSHNNTSVENEHRFNNQKSEKTKLIIKSITTKDKINLTNIANQIIKENHTNSISNENTRHSMFPTPMYNKLKFIEKKSLSEPIFNSQKLIKSINTTKLVRFKDGQRHIEKIKHLNSSNLNQSLIESMNVSHPDSKKSKRSNSQISNITKTSKGLITEIEKEILSKMPLNDREDKKSPEETSEGSNSRKDYKKILEDLKKRVNNTHSQLDQLIEKNKEHNKKFEILQKRTVKTSHNLDNNGHEEDLKKDKVEHNKNFLINSIKKPINLEKVKEFKKSRSKMEVKSDVDDSSMISELLKSLK